MGPFALVDFRIRVHALVVGEEMQWVNLILKR